MFPNPTTDELVIKYAITGSAIKLLNIMGQILYSGTQGSRSTDKKATVVINLDQMPNCIYVVKINDTEVMKMLKQLCKCYLLNHLQCNLQ